MIDVALLDSIMPMMGWVAANLLIGGQQPQLMGNDNFTAAPSGTFRTKDGFINIAANQQQQWEELVEVLGVPELATDPRFQERDTRKKNRALLTPLLEEKLMMKPAGEWVEALNERGIPSGGIATLEEALTSPQVAHRRSIESVDAQDLGTLRLFTLTAKFEKTPGRVESPPPRLSQHTCEILRGLGYEAEEINALRAAGAV
jgi:crotonobetainyl-CoA:carnitine CoA-transferase CaiB-like acyl-CoA transferase